MGKGLALNIPGALSRVGWQLPKDLSREQWIVCGQQLDQIEGAVQWWRGDWWNAGEPYGDRVEIIEKLGFDHGTMRTYGSVAAAYNVSNRLDTLTFTHHFRAMAVPPAQRAKWLNRAVKEGWSAAQLKSKTRSVKRGLIFRVRKFDWLNFAGF